MSSLAHISQRVVGYDDEAVVPRISVSSSIYFAKDWINTQHDEKLLVA